MTLLHSQDNPRINFAPALAPDHITLMSLAVDAAPLESNRQSDDLPPISAADLTEEHQTETTEATEANITAAVEQVIKAADINLTTLPLPRRSDDVTYAANLIQQRTDNSLGAVLPVITARQQLSSHTNDIKIRPLAKPTAPSTYYHRQKTASGQGLMQ